MAQFTFSIFACNGTICLRLRHAGVCLDSVAAVAVPRHQADSDARVSRPRAHPSLPTCLASGSPRQGRKRRRGTATERRPGQMERGTAQPPRRRSASRGSTGGGSGRGGHGGRSRPLVFFFVFYLFDVGSSFVTQHLADHTAVGRKFVPSRSNGVRTRSRL